MMNIIHQLDCLTAGAKVVSPVGELPAQHGAFQIRKMFTLHMTNNETKLGIDLFPFRMQPLFLSKHRKCCSHQNLAQNNEDLRL